MSGHADGQQIRVNIDSDATEVEVVVPPSFPRAMLTEAFCLGVLKQHEVAVTNEVTAAVKDFIVNAAPDGQEARVVVARRREPCHGADGYVEWIVDAQEHADDPEKSFYERHTYVTVEPGQVVARVHEPTPGDDGIDVRGNAIPAKTGKPITIQLDESVMRDGAGQLIAQVQGVLNRAGDRVNVSSQLEIDEYVDFSTGNIEFTGDVLIRKGVRDCFVIQASGCVEVHGLIEAAALRCGQDLLAKGGFAGRERGRATVGRHLAGKYFDNIEADVQGDLMADREVINCELTIHGGLHSPHAAIIGGRVTVVGTAQVGTLGSEGSVETQVVLGTVPKLEPFTVRLESIVTELSRKLEKLQADQTQLKEHTKRRATASDKERETELIFEIMTSQEHLTNAQTAMQALRDRIQNDRKVDLTVDRKIHGGVVICVGQRCFTLQNEVKGPIRIFESARGDVLFKAGEAEPRPLAQIADLSARAA